MKKYSVLACVLCAFTLVCVCGCSDASKAIDQQKYMVQKTPLMGWSSWNAFMVDISDAIIMGQADLLVETGLKDKGFAQVNIDDGYFGFRDADGNMTTHPERFPEGMKGVVDYIHSLGMKAGIYSDAGDNTCGSMYNGDKTGVGAGLLGHDIQDADLYFNEWGFDFIKIDYCGGTHAGLDEETRYREIRHNIDSIANKPVSINICRWAYPGTWVSEAGDSWRTTGDIRPNWKSLKNIIGLNLYLSAFAVNGHYNDMDMLAIGYENNQSGLCEEEVFIITKDYLTEVEENTHFGLWCIMDSPILIGCKLQGIPKHSLELLSNEELIALNQDPLGLQAHVVQHVGETYVLAKDLLLREGPERAVALYNPSEEAVTVTVLPEELGYRGAIKVRDLLKHQDLGKMAQISMEVPAHGVQILKTSGKRQELTRYEAEWAFLPKYSMIAAGPAAVPCESASGRVVVTGLGGEGNTIEWSDIFSLKGGKYLVSVVAAPCDGMVMTVNGEAVALQDNACEVYLKKGYNKVVLSCEGEMPDVDCLEVKKM